jgi:hypothetical protein
MSVTKPPPAEPPRRPRHDIALWASIAAFFGSLASFTLVDIISPGEWVQVVAALLTAAIVAGGVYSHERLADAKREREREEKLAAEREKTL